MNSCKKEQSKEPSGLKVDRSEIKSQITLHSKGLDYYFKRSQNKRALAKIASLDPVPWEPEPPIDGGDPVDIPEAVTDFLIEEGIPYSHEIYLLPQLHVPNLEYHVPSQSDNKFSREFYEVCISITSIEPDDINNAETLIENILTSQKFYALTQLEQTIVVAGAETYLDSYSYWHNRLWLGQLVIGSNISLAIKSNGSKMAVSNKLSWTSWAEAGRALRRYAKADVKGAIGGGIGGAIAGGIVGSAAGGVGAIPGATSGAVVGAIGTGIGNSIIEFLDDEQVAPSPEPVPVPVLEDTTTEIYPGLFVPVFWDIFIQPLAYPSTPVPNIF